VPRNDANFGIGTLAEQDLCVPNYIRDYVAAGSLMSWSASFTDACRQADIYAGRDSQGSQAVAAPIGIAIYSAESTVAQGSLRATSLAFSPASQP
jgi:hypothetical protein